MLRGLQDKKIKNISDMEDKDIIKSFTSDKQYFY